MIIFKQIPGFDNYAISNTGEVWNTKLNKQLKPTLVGEKPRQFLGCGLRANGVRTVKYIHRLVAEAFVPNPEHLRYAIYIDYETRSNTPDNITWSNQMPRRNT